MILSILSYLGAVVSGIVFLTLSLDWSLLRVEKRHWLLCIELVSCNVAAPACDSAGVVVDVCERETWFVVHLLTHSLGGSCMCFDQGLNPQPWCAGKTPQPMELLGQAAGWLLDDVGSQNFPSQGGDFFLQLWCLVTVFVPSPWYRPREGPPNQCAGGLAV